MSNNDFYKAIHNARYEATTLRGLDTHSGSVDNLGVTVIRMRPPTGHGCPRPAALWRSG